MRLARAWWRLERADRMQEGCALRLARAAARTRWEKLNARAIELRMTADTLRALAEEVRQPHYVTAAGHLKLMQHLIEIGEMPEIGDIAFRLLRGLEDRRIRLTSMARRRSSKTDSRCSGPFSATRRRQARKSARSPRPKIPPTRKIPATPPRTLRKTNGRRASRNANFFASSLIMRRRSRMIQSATALEELAEGPMDCERAAEIAPSQPQDLFLRRMEDSNFRQVARLTNMLLKSSVEPVASHPCRASNRLGACGRVPRLKRVRK